MTDAWINFYLIALVAFFAFMLIAYFCQANRRQITQALVYGVLSGLIVGVLSDLLWGKFFGLWSYTLGYEVLPLVVNAVLVWGLFSATVLIMKKLKFAQFFVGIMIMMIAYETANYFLDVWTYEFSLPFFWFFTFLIAGNLAMAIFISVIWHIFLGKKFRFINDFLKKLESCRTWG